MLGSKWVREGDEIGSGSDTTPDAAKEVHAVQAEAAEVRSETARMDE